MLESRHRTHMKSKPSTMYITQTSLHYSILTMLHTFVMIAASSSTPALERALNKKNCDTHP